MNEALASESGIKRPRRWRPWVSHATSAALATSSDSVDGRSHSQSSSDWTVTVQGEFYPNRHPRASNRSHKNHGTGRWTLPPSYISEMLRDPARGGEQSFELQPLDTPRVQSAETGEGRSVSTPLFWGIHTPHSWPTDFTQGRFLRKACTELFPHHSCLEVNCLWLKTQVNRPGSGR